MAEFKPILLTLPSLTPSLVLEVLPYGLTIHRLYVQAGGRTNDIVIGPEDPKDHVTQKYTNTAIGRYTNRIAVGSHTFERNGITGILNAMANESPRVSLHGGPKGFDSVVWTPLTSENPPKLFTTSELASLTESSNESSSVVFRLISEDGDQGFPGRLVVETLVALIAPVEQKRTYHLKGDASEEPEYDVGSILLVYRAKLDEGEKKAVTPINLTQHWGFNLEASLKEGPEPLSVQEHVLTIKSDRIAELDADSLGTNNYIPVSEVPAHAHTSKKIGESLPEKGYDDFYAFEPSVQSPIPTRIPLSSFDANLNQLKDLLQPLNSRSKESRGTRIDPVVELASEKSGLRLLFDTNQHGVMFYSNALAHPTKGARKKIHGGSGISGDGNGYGRNTAVFLEFHEPLAAFLDPKNKDGEDTLLTSEELYNNYVRCDVKFKEPLR